ncbi:SirB1 family protein [Sandaracinus amylolyticus]|uniref:SirB1 family protein n=1 Tax=Sandaracinus amylolyticus TaxID=927083 RepID=UPI001F3F5C6E|nr:transglutaminase-like domain-containing protein [Sandaracinus amylolyticus]UJR78957.1 Regulator of sirC expression with transglutaminase-like and TPR domain [Sandaracinus amylolyticus]
MALGDRRRTQASGASDLLVALADPATPIETLALILAKDEYPSLTVESGLARIDELAAPLAAHRSALVALDAQDQAEALRALVYDELGFRGNADDYYDPRNSYLSDVVDRRTGIPITLSALLMAIGRRIGIVVEGIGFPGHFLVRVGGPQGVHVDPFFEGRVVSESALERLAEKFLGSASQLRPEHLHVVSPRSMVVRMLVNLKHAHERRHDHARALVVSDRLVDVTSSVTFRRDRGLHALALGASAAAVEDLEAYLSDASQPADELVVRRALARARASSATGLS